MSYNVNLPVRGEHGCYEIRLESIGGLGANVCGKILGELGALYLNLNSASFASYGSEKKGSPVKSYIRYSDNNVEIRISSPIESPHILAVFHDRLAGKQGVCAGVAGHTSVVLNTAENPDAARDALKMPSGTLYAIDALKIALECKTRVNMVMLGAIAKASGFIPLEAVYESVSDTFGKKYPQAMKGNIDGIKRGYDEAEATVYADDGKYPYAPFAEPVSELGWKTAPIGGVLQSYGSTVSNDLTASREGYIPVFIKEKCIHCGLCETTCPDFVYQFAEGEIKGKKAMVNLGPDYHHCKGCLRCVEICPTAAIVAGLERENDITKTHVRNRDLVVGRLEFESVGQSGWIESESAVINEI